MPYHMRKRDNKYCVYKGTKTDPGKELKCYTDRKRASSYMAALYINVEDAKTKELLESLAYGTVRLTHDSSMAIHAEQDIMMFSSALVDEEEDTAKDRWIAVSTAEVWDKQREMMTTQAMDYDIRRAEHFNEYPELRLFHIRGFKLGMCDHMGRINKYAVDMGSWHNTPFAQYTKGMVESNDGKWKISRGFYSVEATGLCMKCNTSLMVHPINYIVGGWCVGCKTYFDTPYELERLKHLKTITFDITITDVPAVVETAVSAFSVES